MDLCKMSILLHKKTSWYYWSVVLYKIFYHWWKFSFMCHSKLRIPITAHIFAPILSVARAGSPSYTDSASPVIWFNACSPRVVVCKHNCRGTSLEHITMDCLPGGKFMCTDSRIEARQPYCKDLLVDLNSWHLHHFYLSSLVHSSLMGVPSVQLPLPVHWMWMHLIIVVQNRTRTTAFQLANGAHPLW